MAPLISNMTIPSTSFSGSKLYSLPRAFLGILSLRFFSFTSCVADLEGDGVEAEESVASVDSNDSVRGDCCRFPGNNLARAPVGFEEGVGVATLSSNSVTKTVGVRSPVGTGSSS